MKNFKFVTTFVLLFMSVFGTSMYVNTQQAKAEKVCSNRSLFGAYQTQGSGYLNGNTYALTVLSTFDGMGNITGTILVRSLAGNVITNVPTEGTYKVNSDCSVTAILKRSDGTTANYSGVVYDNGDKYGWTQTDFNTVINLQGERVIKKGRHY
ncbi:MAG: hypothetical protein RM347_031865 [Nostoc sp. ChiQUE02]|uniref:hypothetical protein n=1 Tax=Nostoc sp. ChiQUE02 TaxID=3075377 RepID=UPI002AD27600|nr:hypothetical protein [Nostoc sp. ChiQUE02]MDZ8233765.1 hypothetical protein [Nostoc sp. ChiQUE02]